MNISIRKLKDVPYTMLITLYYRYRESMEQDGLLNDPLYEKIINKIDFDFHRIKVEPDQQISVAARTIIFDNAIDNYIKLNPQGCVISIGAGLNTRFYRLNNEKIKWFNIDLPQAIDFQEQVLEPHVNQFNVRADAFNTEWFKYIPENENIFIFAEGLFLYFEDEKIKQLFNKIANRFKNSYLMFDVVSSLFIQFGDKPHAVDWEKTPFKWAVDSWDKIENWHDKLKFEQEWYQTDLCFNRLSEKWRTALDTFPKVKDFIRVGLFKIS